MALEFNSPGGMCLLLVPLVSDDYDNCPGAVPGDLAELVDP